MAGISTKAFFTNAIKNYILQGDLWAAGHDLKKEENKESGYVRQSKRRCFERRKDGSIKYRNGKAGLPEAFNENSCPIGPVTINGPQALQRP